MANTDLKDIARKVFRGWVIETYPEDSRRQTEEYGALIRKSIEDDSDMEKVDIGAYQLNGVSAMKKRLTQEAFELEVPDTHSIAAKSGISSSEIHELYVIASADYLLGFVFGDVLSFAHEKYTDEQQKEIAFKFVLGIVNETLKSGFREEMRHKERIAIRQARAQGLDYDEIVKLIIRSNDNAINGEDFWRNMKGVVRIFKFGGIRDEREIFHYYKLFFAHLLYRLGTE